MINTQTSISSSFPNFNVFNFKIKIIDCRWFHHGLNWNFLAFSSVSHDVVLVVIQKITMMVIKTIVDCVWREFVLEWGAGSGG